MTAWLGVPARNFSWTGAPPKTRESAKGVRRQFCETCGTPMAFEADHYDGGMHLYAASLEDPTVFPADLPRLLRTKAAVATDGRRSSEVRGSLLSTPEDLSAYD